MFQFMTPVFLVRDPQLIKRMTVKDFDYFMDHKVIISEDLDALFGKALISLTGQKWKGKSFATFTPRSLLSILRLNRYAFNVIARIHRFENETNV